MSWTFMAGESVDAESGWRSDGGLPKNLLGPSVLLLLSERGCRSDELLERLRDLGYPTYSGSLSRVLHSLEQEGMVATQSAGSRPDGCSYLPTPRGIAWLDAWAGHLNEPRQVLERFLASYSTETAVAGRSAHDTKSPTGPTGAPVQASGGFRPLAAGGPSIRGDDALTSTAVPPATPRLQDTPWMKPLPRPYEKIYVFWLAGMSCDGCSIAVTGATNPPLEKLLLGQVPALPKVILHHPVLAIESGAAYVENFRRALRGELDAPYVVCLEGSAVDDRLAGEGYWVALGVGSIEAEDSEMVDGVRQPVSVMSWLKALAPGAAACVAVGTCATWGGVPAAYGNPTGAMSLQDLLGKDYRSALGLPVVNIPGCSPVGDNIMETVAAVVLFLQGLGPLPEFDDLGRPAWLFGETVHRHCVRAGYYEEGVFAKTFGDKECLVEVGCWGPVVQCNITERGAINGMGGCMNTGGPCIGCTMPGFPDKFSPFYKSAPGSFISSNVSRVTGGGMRRLRNMSRKNLNRSLVTDREGRQSSGWVFAEDKVTPIDKGVHYFYDKWQFWGTDKPGSPKSNKIAGRKDAKK